MRKDLVKQPTLAGVDTVTLMVGLSCRNLRGFFFLWVNVFDFVMRTKKADGCLTVCAGIASPFGVHLVSYWETEEAMMRFTQSRAHVRWIKFIYRNPDTLNLFNEVYGVPVRANYINMPGGFSAISP